jgi:hypothetical protein
MSPIGDTRRLTDLEDGGVVMQLPRGIFPLGNSRPQV